MANLCKCPHRLVVRTSRCGCDNPGSTPGEDICTSPALSLSRFRPRQTEACGPERLPFITCYILPPTSRLLVLLTGDHSLLTGYYLPLACPSRLTISLSTAGLRGAIFLTCGQDLAAYPAPKGSPPTPQIHQAICSDPSGLPSTVCEALSRSLSRLFSLYPSSLFSLLGWSGCISRGRREREREREREKSESKVPGSPGTFLPEQRVGCGASPLRRDEGRLSWASKVWETQVSVCLCRQVGPDHFSPSLSFLRRTSQCGSEHLWSSGYDVSFTR